MMFISGSLQRSRTGQLSLWVWCFVWLVPILLGCREVRQTVPKSLQGTWTTEHVLYEDRFMTIESDQISFGTGDAGVDVNSVIAVVIERERYVVTYTIDYLASGGDEYRVRLHYDHRSSELRLAERPQVIWAKEKA